nr:hypothetical protein [Pedobacter glucosidilyticus]
MNKILMLLVFIATLAAGCREDEPPFKEDLYPEEPLSTPSSSVIQVFYANVGFYELFVYRFDPETNRWTNRIRSHFPTVPSDDPTAIGFTNPYVTNSGVSLFDMPRLYQTQVGTLNINTAKINVEKVLRFFPDFEGAKTGIVKVIEQDVVISKTAAAATSSGQPTFKIGISGGGTYDERTKIINLEVIFNETAIGGPADVKRKYTMSVEAQILNP